MEKIKLLKPLWNGKKGDEIEVSTIRAAFALRKGYAEPVLVKLKPKAAKVEKKTKLDPKAEKHINKSFVGHKNIK